MKTIIRRVAYLFSFTAALISSLLFLRLRALLGFVLLGVKLLSNAFAPLLAPEIYPTSLSALYDLERFLALVG